MTVGIVTNSYPPNLNGVAVCVKNLEESLIKKGIKVVIVTPKVPGVEYSDNVYAIPSAPAPSIMSKDLRLTFTYKDNKIIDFLRKNKVNIIHSHDTIMGGQDAIMIGQELKIPVVHTYHTYLESYGYFNIIGYKLFIRNYSKFVCDYSDGVVVLSSKMRNYLNSIGVKTKMYHIPNVYNPKIIQKDQKSRSNYFIEENLLKYSENILVFGRVAKEKNIINSIEKVKPLFQKYPKLRLIILGDGPMFHELEKIIIDENLSKRVLLYGKYNYTDLANIAQFCSIYLNTSYTEVLPTTLIEAASFKLPMVCVNDEAYSYLIQDGVNGKWVDNEEITLAIDSLIPNKHLLKSYKQNAYNSFKEYQRRDYTKEYILMYQDVILNHRHKHLSKKLFNSFQNKLKMFIETFDLNLFDYWIK
ncbi:MAG: glycosyltransferase [Patescibacteria group bacterium]